MYNGDTDIITFTMNETLLIGGVVYKFALQTSFGSYNVHKNSGVRTCTSANKLYSAAQIIHCSYFANTS